jgi:putative transposase
VRRRDLVLHLARQQNCPTAQIDAVAMELGLKRRRVWQLLRLVRMRGPDIGTLLPARRQPKRKRLALDVEAVVAQAIEQHYARPSRPSLFSLWREVDRRCTDGGLTPPSYEAVHARVPQRDRQWLTRPREGDSKARSMRLLTGTHPGAMAPWARVQIDSTPCDLCLVREADRTAIGRPRVTFALDLYSRSPACSSSAIRMSNALLPRRTGLPARTRSRCEGTARYWSKTYVSALTVRPGRHHRRDNPRLLEALGWNTSRVR